MSQMLMFSSEELHANHLVSPDSEKDWMTHVATSCLPILPLLQSLGPNGWFGKTSPACYPVTEDSTLPHYFEGWANAGMGSHTEFLTLSTLEWPSDAAVCLLSDVLEIGEVPQRFFLSGHGLCGYSAPSREKRKSIADCISAGIAISDYEVAGTLDKGIPGRGIGHNGNYDSQVVAVGSLCARTGQSISVQDGEQGHFVALGMAVRRLTPVECERLQGFLDNYTDIQPKGKATPDGPRYKALGNSMAVPVMAWIGKRIQEVENIK